MPISGYNNSIIGHPAYAGTAPCPPPHAQRKRILTRVGKRVQSPSSTTRATPSARCGTKPSPSTSSPVMRWPVPVSSTARATTTPQGLMSARPFASIWSAASLLMALPGRGVTIVDMTTSSPIPARAVAPAPRAIPGAWWRRRRTSRITSSPACRCANGCCSSAQTAALLYAA